MADNQPWDEEIPGVNLKPWELPRIPPYPGPGMLAGPTEPPAVGATAPAPGMGEKAPGAPAAPPGFGERYKQHMAEEPQREKYQLSPRRKFFAGLLATTAHAFNPQINAGETFENALGGPYNRAMTEWQRKGAGLEKEAQLQTEQEKLNQYDTVPVKDAQGNTIMIQRRDVDNYLRDQQKEAAAKEIQTQKGGTAKEIAHEHNQTLYDIAKLKGENARHNVKVMGDRTYEELSTGQWTDIGPAPPHAEQGNYMNMFDNDGHFLGWANPKSGRMVGPDAFPALQAAAGGAEVTPQRMSAAAQGRAEQAKAIARAAPPIISEINRLKPKIGNLSDYWKQITMGSPIADAELAGLAAELVSFAALQPAAHGARGLQAIKAFESAIGGIPKDADALIAAIQGTVKTTGALIPPARGGGATTPATPAVGGGAKIDFRPSTRPGG